MLMVPPADPRVMPRLAAMVGLVTLGAAFPLVPAVTRKVPPLRVMALALTLDGTVPRLLSAAILSTPALTAVDPVQPALLAARVSTPPPFRVNEPDPVATAPLTVALPAPAKARLVLVPAKEP